MNTEQEIAALDRIANRAPVSLRARFQCVLRRNDSPWGGPTTVDPAWAAIHDKIKTAVEDAFEANGLPRRCAFGCVASPQRP